MKPWLLLQRKHGCQKCVVSEGQGGTLREPLAPASVCACSPQGSKTRGPSHTQEHPPLQHLIGVQGLTTANGKTLYLEGSRIGGFTKPFCLDLFKPCSYTRHPTLRGSPGQCGIYQEQTNSSFLRQRITVSGKGQLIQEPHFLGQLAT